jgi:hypothetical protein
MLRGEQWRLSKEARRGGDVGILSAARAGEAAINYIVSIFGIVIEISLLGGN